MESMQELIQRLQVERNEYSRAVDRIDKAIDLLRGSGKDRGRATRNSTQRTMSPEARRRISLAMKRRHARARSQKRKTTTAQKSVRTGLHWTQTPAGRKKFAAIRAKAHSKAA
jgi:hypothetical protein